MGAARCQARSHDAGLWFGLTLPFLAQRPQPVDTTSGPGATLVVLHDRTTVWRRDGALVLTVVPSGTELTVVRRGAWYEVQLPPALGGAAMTGRISGASVAVIPRSPTPTAARLGVSSSAARGQSPVALAPKPSRTAVKLPRDPTVASPPRPAATPRRSERLHGYVEWKRDGAFIVEGQRLVTDRRTRLKLKGVNRLRDVPVGFEVTAKGGRQPDGAILAWELEAKPNGVAMFEADLFRSGEAMEQAFRRKGALFDPATLRSSGSLGPIRETGSDVDRVRAIAERVVPPYLDASKFRVYVVDADVWNAMVLPNGSIWIMGGLLKGASDDELAVVIGHELAHYTHEHTRQRVKNQLWISLVGAATSAALQQMSNQNAASGLAMAANLGLAAWRNGYSREQEDQADRVGLRYAYEAGFDVTRAPALWRRRQEQDGQPPKVVNLMWVD